VKKEEHAMDTVGSTLQKATASLRHPTNQVMLITLLGMVEGEILTHIETHGATALPTLARALEWPMPLVIMAAGALIRRGLVRGVQSRRVTLLEPQPEAALA
jgi:hypothetical protein